MATEEDELWGPTREPLADVAARGAAFLSMLRGRSEAHIVVVSHGVFLETLLTLTGLGVTARHKQAPHGSAGRWMNCEMRSFMIGDWA